MKKSRNRKIITHKKLNFGIKLVICILLLLFLHDISFEFTGTFSYPRIRRESENAAMELKLSALIEEEDRFQLQETGFSCNSDLETDVCITANVVRIDTKSLRMYISSTPDLTPQVKYIKIVKPYAKKTDNTAMGRVRPLQIVHATNSRLLPNCDHTHTVPVVVFSSGGFSDNIFHVLSEMIIPLFLTSWHFRSQVRFLITDYSPLWIEQYGRVLNRLSSYETVNADNGGVHCFPGGVIGLKYHQFLGINSTKIPIGYNYDDFRRFLFDSYDLKVNTLSLLVKQSKPVVVLISRTGSRMLLNEDKIVSMMVELGFEVRIVIPSDMSDLENFSSLVNSCHVLLGVHGAGIANEVFLPKGALVVEIVPIGLEWQSTNYYAEPASKMGLKYLKYHIELEESSLNGSYSSDDPVIIDPPSIYTKGYLIAKAIYLDGQNLRINLSNFRDTMSHAFELLQN